MTKKNGTSGHLVWIDMEMTGLNPDTDEVIEIATIITDANLNEIARGPEIVIHQPPERFVLMDAWNQEHHQKSGLWDKVLSSTVNVAEAEQETLDFVKKHCEAGKSPLCGNSVWQDRRFLYKYMPALEAHLHYRIIDVSTVKELLTRWAPTRLEKKEKKQSHRALDDIEESIEELRGYRKILGL